MATNPGTGGPGGSQGRSNASVLLARQVRETITELSLLTLAFRNAQKQMAAMKWPPAPGSGGGSSSGGGGGPGGGSKGPGTPVGKTPTGGGPVGAAKLSKLNQTPSAAKPKWWPATNSPDKPGGMANPGATPSFRPNAGASPQNATGGGTATPRRRRKRNNKDADLDFGEAVSSVDWDSMGKAGQKMEMAASAHRMMGGDKEASKEASGDLIGAAVKQFVGRIQEFNKGIGEFKAGIGRAATQDTLGGTMSGAGVAGKGLAKILGPTGGPLVGAISNFVGKIGEAIEGLRLFGKSLHDANMQFAEYSAGMARVQAFDQMRQIFRERDRGDRRAASAEYLMENRNKMEDQLTIIEDHLANLKNYATGWLQGELAEILAVLNAWFGLAAGPAAGDPGMFSDDFRRLGVGDLESRARGVDDETRPPRWRF